MQAKIDRLNELYNYIVKISVIISLIFTILFFFVIIRHLSPGHKQKNTRFVAQAAAQTGCLRFCYALTITEIPLGMTVTAACSPLSALAMAKAASRVGA